MEYPLKVSDLIRELEKFDKDAFVVIFDGINPHATTDVKKEGDYIRITRRNSEPIDTSIAFRLRQQLKAMSHHSDCINEIDKLWTPKEMVSFLENFPKPVYGYSVSYIVDNLMNCNIPLEKWGTMLAFVANNQKQDYWIGDVACSKKDIINTIGFVSMSKFEDIINRIQRNEFSSCSYEEAIKLMKAV